MCWWPLEWSEASRADFSTFRWPGLLLHIGGRSELWGSLAFSVKHRHLLWLRSQPLFPLHFWFPLSSENWQSSWRNIVLSATLQFNYRVPAGGKVLSGSESPSDQSVILLVDDGSATGQEIRKDLPFGVSLWMGDKGWAWKGLVAPKGWCGWGWNKGKSEGRTGWHGLCVPFPSVARLRALASGHTTFLKPEEQDSEGRGSKGRGSEGRGHGGHALSASPNLQGTLS